MKKIKIFAFPSHQEKDRTHGVDFVRVIQPMKYLHGYKDEDVEFEVSHYDISKEANWMDIAKNHDIIYFNYTASAWGYAAMGVMARKFGVKMVLDLDDNIWEIRSDNPAHAYYKKGGQGIYEFTAICNDVDYMTTTNSYLKNVIINNTYVNAKNIKVFPNYIDLDLYSHRSPFKNTLNIQLMHHGSTTHFEDLSNKEFMKGIEKIMSEYPNVNIRFVGAFLPEYRERFGMRYENVFGHQDIYKWVKEKFPLYMDEADIIVVPLEENRYTRCKSSIKYIETSSAKKPGLWADIRQYREVIRNGENGFLCRTAEDWYKNIKFLIDNPEARKKMGETAFEDVEKNYTIQAHVKDYAEYFKQMLEKQS